MARAAKPLTYTEVKAAKATTKDETLYDGGGLELLVKVSGVKTWRFRCHSPTTNKRFYLTFGHYPALSLADARMRKKQPLFFHCYQR